MINENGIIENAGTILPLVMIIIIGTFLFYQRIKVLKIEHLFDLDEALSVQRMELKAFYENVIANIQRVNQDKIRSVKEELEQDFIRKIRLLGHEKDNILTTYEEKIPIMTFALEPSSHVRFSTPMPDKVKKEEKLYHVEGMVFSYSDHNELSYGKVYELLRTEVAKWLIDSQMVIGRYNRNSREVEFRLRYLCHQS